MKKQYETPDVYFDSFTLSTSIASCKIHNYTMSNGDCGFPMGGRVIFTADVAGCQKENGGKVVEDGSLYDGLCYHVPFETNNLFNS